jgi:hypothetical protein
VGAEALEVDVGQQRYATGARLVGVVVLALVAGVLGIGPASAAPQAGPAPVRELVAQAQHVAAKQATTSTRQALRIPGEEDEETFVGFSPTCAAGKGKAKPNGFVYASSKVKLDWVLTGTGYRKTGTVKTKADRPVTLKLPSVRAGDYRVTLALHGRTELVADASFDVLPCVVVKATCRALTFTNPASNPPAYVYYHGHKKKQEFSLALAPGASRTVRADYSKIDFDAASDDPDEATDALGHGTVKVKQGCKHGPAQPAQNAVQTQGLAGCSTAGTPATVTLRWVVQPSVTKRSYEVLGANGLVAASGSYKGGRDTELSLPAGSYTYRSHANGIVAPFEDVAFTVLDCVVVTPRCRAIEVQNPNAASLGVLVLGEDDEETGVDGDGEVTTVPGGSTVTIPWTGASAWLLALPDGAWEGDAEAAFFSIGSPLSTDGEPLTVEVPQNC